MSQTTEPLAGYEGSAASDGFAASTAHYFVSEPVALPAGFQPTGSTNATGVAHSVAATNLFGGFTDGAPAGPGLLARHRRGDLLGVS